MIPLDCADEQPYIGGSLLAIGPKQQAPRKILMVITSYTVYKFTIQTRKKH